MKKRRPHARELHRRRYQPQTVPDRRSEHLEEAARDEIEEALEEVAKDRPSEPSNPTVEDDQPG